jgi:membrane fusion protein
MTFLYCIFVYNYDGTKIDVVSSFLALYSTCGLLPTVSTISKIQRTAASLFRQEVAEAKKLAWLGPVQLVQPLSVKTVTAISAALILGAILFAFFGSYTRRMHATGIVIPTAGLITVASPAVGVATSVVVREGDRVEKGSLLYVINLDTQSSDGATEQQIIAQLTQQKTNLEKQRDIRRSLAQGEKQGLKDQQSNLVSQYDQLAHQVGIQESAVGVMKNKAEVLERGVKNGIVRDSDFQTQNYLYIQTISQLAQFQQMQLQMKGKIADLDRQLAAFDDKLAQDINQIEREILHIDQQITENQAKRAIEVRAPEYGTATSIRVHVGQQVTAGAPLVTLLPQTGALEVSLFVDSAAIGFIEKGAPVILRYAAYPFQRFGLYGGVVKEVTRAPISTMQQQVNESATGTQGGLYRILVEPKAPYVVAYGQRKSLEAGMRVDADIGLEKRRLYRWLFDPLYHLQRSVTLVSDGAVQ